MLKIKKSTRSDIRTITFEGDWDLFEKERASGYFSELYDSDIKGVIIDLTDISFMDSSAIEIIIGGFIDLRAAGVPMAIVTDHNNYLIRKFRNLGIFDGVGMSFFETVAEARSALSR